ncbi:hypothetical protein SKC41_29940 [Mycobacterium sp. 050128]|uniref:hypothetical protein n=1 Tax=Mycobacterium sp. 050128 TaxID=3096112 RepID=UPI002ED8A0DF
MVNINSKSAARKRVREAQLRANEARVERERQNVDDAASVLVELGRLAAVEEWEATRILEVRAEGERRRYEHRQAAAAAVARMQGRGETLAAIAALTGVKTSDVRAVLKAASARTGAAPEALGAANGAAPEALGAANGAAPEALGAANGAAPERG